MTGTLMGFNAREPRSLQCAHQGGPRFRRWRGNASASVLFGPRAGGEGRERRLRRAARHADLLRWTRGVRREPFATLGCHDPPFEEQIRMIVRHRGLVCTLTLSV